MKFYIDFDHTIFNSMKFNEERYKILQKYGINIEEQIKLEKQITQDSGKLIDLDYVYSKISDKYNLQKKEILGELHQIIDNCYKYLYNDTIEFLKYLKQRGNEVYLLTWGNKKYQEQKVMASKIKEYFDGIIITEDFKFDIDIDYKNGIFIDDNPRDLEGLYKKDPVEVIRIKRDNARYSSKPLNIAEIREFKSLKELQVAMENNSKLPIM